MTEVKPLRFVVPIDGSPLASQAIPFAQALAAPPAEIILVDVIHEAHPERTLIGSVAVDASVVQRRETRAAQSVLAGEADRIRVDTPWIGLTITTAIGEPVDGIVKVAREHDADCVVIAHGKQHLIERVALGSVTDGLIRTGAVSVLVVRPRDAAAGLAAADFRRIVVPLDGSATAERALPLARRIARHTRLPVQIVTVVREGEPAPAGVERQRDALIEDGVRASVELLTGNPERAIEQAVSAHDLLVIGSHHGTGVTAWLARGVTERLISHGSCPVLVVYAGGAGSAAPAD